MGKVLFCLVSRIAAGFSTVDTKVSADIVKGFFLFAQNVTFTLSYVHSCLTFGHRK